jgi:hypothetical protein
MISSLRSEAGAKLSSLSSFTSLHRFLQRIALKRSSEEPRCANLVWTHLDVVRPYSVAEVNRLAPAAEMKRLLICVTASPQSRPEPVLQIWSLLDTGENWWKFLHHEVGGGRPPPNFLTVTSTSSGEVAVSAAGNVLATLRNGQILRPTTDALWSGP